MVQLMTSFKPASGFFSRDLFGEQHGLRLLDDVAGRGLAAVLPPGWVEPDDVIGGEVGRVDVVVPAIPRHVGRLRAAVDASREVGSRQDDDLLLAVVAGARWVLHRELGGHHRTEKLLNSQ